MGGGTGGSLTSHSRTVRSMLPLASSPFRPKATEKTLELPASDSPSDRKMQPEQPEETTVGTRPSTPRRHDLCRAGRPARRPPTVQLHPTGEIRPAQDDLGRALANSRTASSTGLSPVVDLGTVWVVARKFARYIDPRICLYLIFPP